MPLDHYSGSFHIQALLFEGVLNGGELKVEDAVTHSPEYLLSSSYISLLLFLRFLFFFLIQSYSNTEVTTVHTWMLL